MELVLNWLLMKAWTRLKGYGVRFICKGQPTLDATSFAKHAKQGETAGFQTGWE